MPDGPSKFKKAVVNPGTDKPGNVGANSIINQFDFARSYVNSPMYAQRLAKMVNTERGLPGSVNAAGGFTSELLNGYKSAQPVNYVASNIIKGNNQNLDAVADKISITNDSLGKNVAGGYDSSFNDVRFNAPLLSQNPTVPGHEFSHAVNDGVAPYSEQFKSKLVDNFMVPASNSMFEGEVQKPTEVKARLDAVRGLAAKKGLYDARKENFTKEHLDKLRKDPEVKNDFNFKQLQDQLKKEKKDDGFIWLMNNIAQNKQPETINATAAWT